MRALRPPCTRSSVGLSRARRHAGDSRLGWDDRATYDEMPHLGRMADKATTRPATAQGLRQCRIYRAATIPFLQTRSGRPDAGGYLTIKWAQLQMAFAGSASFRRSAQLAIIRKNKPFAGGAGARRVSKTEKANGDPGRTEPATGEGRCSIRLSYGTTSAREYNATAGLPRVQLSGRPYLKFSA